MTTTAIGSTAFTQTAVQSDVKQTSSDSSGTSFSKLMNKVTSHGTSDQKVDSKASEQDKKVQDTDKSDSDSRDTQTDKANGNTAEQTVKPENTKASGDSKSTDAAKQKDETQDAAAQTGLPETAMMTLLQNGIQQTADQMITALADTLHVSTEAVTGMMKKLNMTAADLLQPDQLKNLALALSGDTDGTSLLTNGDLYASVKSLFGTLQDMETQLQSETGLSAKQIQSILETMQNKAAQNENSEAAAQSGTAVTANAVLTAVYPDKTAAQNTEKQDGTGQTGNAVAAVHTTAEKTSSDNTAAGVQKAAETESTGQTAEDFKLQTSGKQETYQSGNQTDSSANQFVMNFTKNPDQILENQTAEVKPAFTVNSPDEVITQIVDYIKVQVKPETSHLEMQLHPENLGTLNIQISSKEGVMTAQFTTQSEEVRSVIQSQITDLRQSLENQGIKVDAVEVTVANYSRDNSPSDGQQQGGQSFAGRKRGTRAINLNALSDTEEDLGQEEQITAQMMKANGNTVDYTV